MRRILEHVKLPDTPPPVAPALRLPAASTLRQLDGAGAARSLAYGFV
ncbi:MAG: hypothetical protein L0Y66_25615 [Myxococcaceae bacterium]|nr:hypothetical protein [Myxococcaceae bacterium]MCI0669450.1 hypothetical protein [Myxococcaceae bacterium]